MTQIKYACQDRPRSFKVNKGNHIIKPVNGKILWHLSNMTPDMEKHEVVLAFSQAFDILAFHMWPIRFEATKYERAGMITIEFTEDDTFDKGVLAYAYFPGHRKQGIVKVNEAVNWSDMHKSGSFHLRTVILHEFCHSLGVDHSDVPEALMFPTYAGVRLLRPDDVNALNHLYRKERIKAITQFTSPGIFIKLLNLKPMKQPIDLTQYLVVLIALILPSLVTWSTTAGTVLLGIVLAVCAWVVYQVAVIKRF